MPDQPSNWKEALKRLYPDADHAPRCPSCGEQRMIVKTEREWCCDVCSATWKDDAHGPPHHADL